MVRSRPTTRTLAAMATSAHQRRASEVGARPVCSAVMSHHPDRTVIADSRVQEKATLNLERVSNPASGPGETRYGVGGVHGSGGGLLGRCQDRAWAGIRAVSWATADPRPRRSL